MRTRFWLGTAASLLAIALPVLVHAEAALYRLHGADRGAAMALLEAGFDVASARPGTHVDVLADEARRSELEAFGFRVETLPLARQIPSAYRDYAEIVSALTATANVFSSIAMMVDVGDGWGSVYGGSYPDRELWAMKLSDNVAVDEAEPVVMYTGVTHAREPMSGEICMALLNALVSGYGSDPDITAWIDGTEIWILPLVNPDGFYAVTDLAHDFWRKNVRDNDDNGQITVPGFSYPDGVDLNRNFDWEFGGSGSSAFEGEQNYRGPFGFSEPETQDVRDLSLAVNPLFAVDYHSYGEFIIFPFGFDTSTQTPDHALLESIAAEMASRVDKLGAGTYDSFIAYDLYPAAGNSIDWRYGTQNTFAFTPETGTSFIPSSTTMQQVVADNLPGALYVLERTADGPGLKGIVTANGLPAPAEIVIDGVDQPALANSRRNEPTNGDYYRVLGPGSYTVTVRHLPSSDTQTFPNVVIGSTGWTTLDVAFTTVSVPPADGRTGALRAFPNPFARRTDITFTRKSAQAGAIGIFDASGRRVRDLAIGSALTGRVRWDGRDRNGTRVPAGIYFAKISGVAGATTIHVIR